MSGTIRYHVTQTVEIFHILHSFWSTTIPTTDGCFEIHIVLLSSTSISIPQHLPSPVTTGSSVNWCYPITVYCMLCTSLCAPIRYTWRCFARQLRTYLHSVHFLVCGTHGTNVKSESNWVRFVCLPTQPPAKFRYSALNWTKSVSFHILFNSLAISTSHSALYNPVWVTYAVVTQTNKIMNCMSSPLQESETHTQKPL